MKNLDETQVYDLRGITEEQSKELLEWLINNDGGWQHFTFLWFMEDGSLEYYSNEWIISDRASTALILTLFDPEIRTDNTEDYITYPKPPKPLFLGGGVSESSLSASSISMSCKEELQEDRRKLEHYIKEVERLENERRPTITSVCKFWDSNNDDFVIGVLTDTDESDFSYQYKYQVGGYGWYEHAKKVTEQEVIDLLFNKSCK